MQEFDITNPSWRKAYIADLKKKNVIVTRDPEKEPYSSLATEADLQKVAYRPYFTLGDACKLAGVGDWLTLAKDDELFREAQKSIGRAEDNPAAVNEPISKDEFEKAIFRMRDIREERKVDEQKLFPSDNQNQIYDGYASKQATSFVLEKLKAAGIEVVTGKDEFEKRLDEINGTDVFQAMTEKFVEKEINSVPRATKEIRETLEKVLEKTAAPFTEVAYTRENYLQIFRDGIVQTPVETVKLGANQFVRLCPPDRNNLMGAIYETMTKPSIVLEKETFDEKSEKFKPVHVYGKSFINEKDNHKRAVESIVIFRDGENIAASLHNRDISKFVDQIKTADDIIYIDNEVSRVAAFSSRTGDSHVVKEAQEFLSSSGHKSLPSWNKFYNPEDVLSIKKLIDDGKVQGGTVEINENNFDKYFNIFNQNLKYKDNRNKIASDLFNYHVKPENKAEMKEWLENQGYEIKEKIRQFEISNGNVYGFTDGEKIYLNPDFMNSNVAVHEYTHLWDEYTRRTNPELWQKGMNIFKDTKFWSEVKSDPNYADIADDDNLVLSEVHARITGEMAQKVLERIAKENGEITKEKAIDWDRELNEFIAKEFGFALELGSENYISDSIKAESLKEFLATPMKELMAGRGFEKPEQETTEEPRKENSEDKNLGNAEKQEFASERNSEEIDIENTSAQEKQPGWKRKIDNLMKMAEAEENENKQAQNQTAENEKNETLNSVLEQTSLENAADLLKSISFNSGNYKELVDVINKITEISGKEKIHIPSEEAVKQEEKGEINTAPELAQNQENVIPNVDVKSYVSDQKFTGENPSKAERLRQKLIENGTIRPNEDFILISEKQAEAAGCKIKTEAESVMLLCPTDGVKSDFHDEKYFHISAVDDMKKLEKFYNHPSNEVENDETQWNHKIIYGKTVLPDFSVIADGKLQPVKNAVVTGYDKESKNYLLNAGAEKIELPAETFKTLFNDKLEQEMEQIKVAEGMAIVFEDKERGIKGTVLPEFSMITQNGIRSYKDCVVQSFNPADKTYTLSNGDTTLSVTEERFKEISSEERFENKFDENTPSYKKLLQTQYNDYFKQRDNTSYNFRHNLSVYCRKEANSPLDALRLAKDIVSRMPKDEQRKTKSLLKKIRHENESINEVIVRTYHDAIKEVPLNEDYIKKFQPEKVIARPFYDTISDNGKLIENDSSLIKGEQNRNLKIGDTIKNVDFSSEKLFGLGKKNVHFAELKVVSASKEGNSITLMDANKSYFKLPRDTFLDFYKARQLKEMKIEQKNARRNSISLSYA